MTTVIKIAAPLSIVILAVMSALPWGVPADSRFVLPMLPAVAIHYWILRGRAEAVPEWFVFAVGLLLDILTNGPLGFWPLVYLLTYVLASVSIPYSREGPVKRWILMFAAMTGVATAAWLVTSMYSLQLADWQPFVWGAAAASLSHPLLAFLFRAIDGRQSRNSNVLFERGT